MESHTGTIMTLSNSIIGVSILAMPFCFKQCGIILSILALMISSVITRLTCHFLLKSAIMARRRTFELLAFHAFGTTGKFMVELGIIGFLMGTCIAFFVIIGDLGPAIIAKIMGTKATSTLRTSILIGVALFCVLPLGLLKNVDSLHNVSTATIGFYFCLVLKTISESTTHLLSSDWLSKVELWRPIGILQCLPIFAMALSCQTQLFEIYETMANPTLEKMNYIVRIATNICVAVYVCVGFFGYAAFASVQFSGNILMSFSPSVLTDVMKIGFVLSVAFSFPLVIFPCRASLYSLLFRKGYNPYEGASNYIPESKFKFLTALIVATSLLIGIMIPNIEVVLGLIGSTIGTMICLIFPVTCFICISTKNTNERLLAQIMLFTGVIVMVLGTYANLYAMEKIHDEVVTERSHIIPNPGVDMKKEIMKIIEADNFKQPAKDNNIDILPNIQVNKNPIVEISNVKEVPKEIRVEPPQPVEPQEIPNKIIVPLNIEVKTETPETVVKKPDKPDNNADVKEAAKQNIDKQNANNAPDKKSVNTAVSKKDEVDSDAIKKEDRELQEDAKNKENEDEKKKAELLKKLEEHKKQQENLIQEQKKLLQEIKQKQEELKVKEKEEIEKEEEIKRKAVDQIVEIAKQALKEIVPRNVLTDKKDEAVKDDSAKQIKDIEDPIIKQLQNLSRLNERKTVSREMMIPLPLAKNKGVNQIFAQNEVIKPNNEEQNVKKMDQKINRPNILPVTKLNTVEKEDRKENPIHLGENTNKRSDIKAAINEPNLNAAEIKKESVLRERKESKISGNNEENVKAGQRDILANNDSTDSFRVKRELSEKEKLQNGGNNEKCSLKEKDKLVGTGSPFIKLVTEISKSDI